MRPITDTIFIGKELHHLAEVDSTNAYVQYLLSKSEPADGLVVFADSQFAGRGQLGTKWLSEARQNIITSVLLYPRFLMSRHIFYLNKAIALAIKNFVQLYVEPDSVSIKWPNDIYIGNAKVAGILIETAIQQSILKHAILGIGININQTIFDKSLTNVVSLKLITGMQLSIPSLLNSLFVCLEKQYMLLRSFNFHAIDQDYATSLFGLNRPMQFKKDDTVFTGSIQGVSDEGKLIVLVNDIYTEFFVKEVQMIL